MKTYEVMRVPNKKYQYLVLSTSYLNPLDSLSEIQIELSNAIECQVLFDLLLAVGTSDNRYIEATYNGNSFDFSSFKTVEVVDEKIREVTISYYQDKNDYLSNSVLSRAQQFLLSKGRL